MHCQKSTSVKMQGFLHVYISTVIIKKINIGFNKEYSKLWHLVLPWVHTKLDKLNQLLAALFVFNMLTFFI
jgi:hypothetical protein